MKYFFDTEFIDNGETIDLISIGIVRDDSEQYYAINRECAFQNASQWVEENVIKKLENPLTAVWKLRHTIRKDVQRFIGSDPKPEFWAYYGAYDWVAFCQLFGTMMDLPKGYPFYCNDIKQLCVSLGDPKLPKQTSDQHHALADAIWTRDAYQYLQEYRQGAQ